MGKGEVAAINERGAGGEGGGGGHHEGMNR